MYEVGDTKSSHKAVFFPKVIQENSVEISLTDPRGRRKIERMLTVSRGHESEAFLCRYESRSILSPKAKTNEKTAQRSTSERYLGQTTFLQLSVPYKNLNCFSGNGVGVTKPILLFLFELPDENSLGMSTS